MKRLTMFFVALVFMVCSGTPSQASEFSTIEPIKKFSIPYSYLQGIAYDGNNLFVTSGYSGDGGSESLYKIDTDGNLISQYDFGWVPSRLCWDGNILWMIKENGPDTTDEVIKLQYNAQKDNFIELSRFMPSLEVTDIEAMTYANGYIWVTQDEGSYPKLYKLSTSGEVVEIFEATHFDDVDGLAYDGTYMLASTDEGIIYKINIYNGNVIKEYQIIGSPEIHEDGGLSFNGDSGIWVVWRDSGVLMELDNITDIPDTGNVVTSDLWIRAVINTEEKGRIEAVWKKGGEDTTSRGDRVVWGHFYASPSDVTWGSQNNPDLFVKIWFDVSGRVDVNYFHVSVPEIEVYSDYPYDGTVDEHGITTMNRRYIRQYYENSQSYSDENYENGNPPSGYTPTGNPSGYSIINDLRIGSIINTVEKGPIDTLWRLGGQDTTSRGDQVVWGHFYANPSDVTWGSQNNPDLFMKIWFDVSGRVDVNFFHVSVPDIEVYSDLPNDATYDQHGTTIMDNRYIRNEYWR